MDRLAERLLSDGGVLDQLTAKLAADGGLLNRVEHLEHVAGSVATRTGDRVTVDVIAALVALAALVVTLLAYVAWLHGKHGGYAMVQSKR
jgi:hypothetical protein